LLSCFSACLASNLFAVVTEYSENNQQTRVTTVQLNRNTGAVTNVTTNFVYAGGSASIDGISAFDQINGRYYFAPDSVTAFIYGTDVKNKHPLPTLDIGADTIDRLTFDGTNNRLYAIFAAKTGTYLAAIGPETFQPILQIPSQFNVGYIMTGAVDGRRNTYYLAAKIGSTPTPTYAIATINLSNGQIIRQAAIDNRTCTLFPEYLWFDSSSGNLLGAGEAQQGNQLAYYFLKISPATGSCVKLPISAPDGIITAFSFDSSTNQLWMAEATNNGPYIFSYNVVTGRQTTPVQVASNLTPESLEVALNF